MNVSYPLRFTLQDGTQVEVVHVAMNSYSFTFRFSNGTQKEMIYTQPSKDEQTVAGQVESYEMEALHYFWHLQRQ